MALGHLVRRIGQAQKRARRALDGAAEEQERDQQTDEEHEQDEGAEHQAGRGDGRLRQHDTHRPAGVQQRGEEDVREHAVHVDQAGAGRAGQHLPAELLVLLVRHVVVVDVVEEIVRQDARRVRVGDVVAFAAQDETVGLHARVRELHPADLRFVDTQVLLADLLRQPGQRQVGGEHADHAPAPVPDGQGIGAEHVAGAGLVVVGVRPESLPGRQLDRAEVPFRLEVIMARRADLPDFDLSVRVEGGVDLVPAAFLREEFRDESRRDADDVGVQAKLFGQRRAHRLRRVEMLGDFVQVVGRGHLHHAQDTLHPLVGQLHDILVMVGYHRARDAVGEVENQAGRDGHDHQHHQENAARQTTGK